MNRLMLCGLGLSLACQPSTLEVDIDVVTPEDADELEAANNVAVVLAPDGASYSGAADGLDFEVSLELDPDDTLRTLALYLAQDDTLLAWGRTAEFTYGAASEGIALFLGRPGALSTFPLVLDLPDDGLLATAVPGRGVVMLSSSGATSYIDGFTLVTSEADALSDPPPADDGVLVGDSNAGAMRVAWATGLRSHRFDPGEDAWIDVEHDGADIVGDRPGAAWVVDGAGEVLTVFGGGEFLDSVAIDLAPRSDDTLRAAKVDVPDLDAPRRLANATWVTRADGDDAEEVILFGADDERGVLWLVRAGVAIGPDGPWIAGRCIALDPGDDGAAVRVLCGGGERNGAPTGDALVVTVPLAGDAAVEDRPALLDPPMPSPLWLVDDVAVYAQGEGVLAPFDKATLAPAAPGNGLRARGGQTVVLDGGATLLVGGSDPMGAPTTRIQVFTPGVPSE